MAARIVENRFKFRIRAELYNRRMWRKRQNRAVDALRDRGEAIQLNKVIYC